MGTTIDTINYWKWLQRIGMFDAVSIIFHDMSPVPIKHSGKPLTMYRKQIT